MEIVENAKFGIARYLIDDDGQNYNFIVWCQETSECAVIDPSLPVAALKFIAEKGFKTRYVINTHAHPDHISGNDPIIKVSLMNFSDSRASKILVHPAGKHLVSQRSGSIEDGDIISLGNIEIKVIHTPGHCPEHVALLLDDYLFAGDTLFSAGCGNTHHRGNVEELYASIAFKLGVLPDDTKLFYGHEYTLNNLKFAHDLEPDNKAVTEKLEMIEGIDLSDSYPPIPTLGEEKTYNPFLRFDSPELIASVQKKIPETGDDPFEVFKSVRMLKDQW